MQVIIMRGIPGSGKSSYVSQLPNQDKILVVSADHYHITDGKYRFDLSKAGEAHDKCLRAYMEEFDSEMCQPETLVVDNTNITAWEIAPYYRIAEVHGCPVKIVRCTVDFELAVKRNIHGVPDATIWNMMHALTTDRLPQWWKEEFFFTGGPSR